MNPVRVHNTGQVFPSLWAALDALGVDRQGWHYETIRSGYRIDGWLIDPMEPDDPQWDEAWAMRPPGGRPARPVRCVETGAIYRSCSDAAAAAFVTLNAIHQSVRRGNRAGGFHWEYASPEVAS